MLSLILQLPHPPQSRLVIPDGSGTALVYEQTTALRVSSGKNRATADAMELHLHLALAVLHPKKSKIRSLDFIVLVSNLN
jgi:hypothetical protein